MQWRASETTALEVTQTERDREREREIKMTSKDLGNNLCSRVVEKSCHGLFMPMSFNFYLHAYHIIPQLALSKSFETSQTV